MRSVEVQARSSEEAIKIALKKLKTTRDKVKIEILCEETKGLFGMHGAQSARVKVSLKPPSG
jgi:spoIIIJ-associated protein